MLLILHIISVINGLSLLLNRLAVQNERDRISVRRASYDDVGQNGALSVGTLQTAELLSRQVRRPTIQLGEQISLKMVKPIHRWPT